MGRDESAGAPPSVKTAQARRSRQRQGDTTQVAVVKGRNKAPKKAAVDPFIEAIRGRIDDEINQNNHVRDKTHLHASEMCKSDWCPRYSWYKLCGGERDKEDSTYFRLNSIFIEGNYIHEKWQSWLWELGILEGNFRCKDCKYQWWAVSPVVCDRCASVHLKYAEVPIANEDIMQIGQADGIYRLDGERDALEIKSIGVGTLRFDAPDLYEKLTAGEMTLDQVWKSIKAPFPVHLRQGMLYLRDLKDSQGINKMRFVYEFKPTQEFKSWLVTYNDRYLARMLNGAFAIKRAIDSGGTVKRPSWAEDDHPVCKKCPYYTTCWGSDAKPA